MSQQLWIAGAGLIGQEIAKFAKSQGFEIAMTDREEKITEAGSVGAVDITNYDQVRKYLEDHHFNAVIVAAGIALPAAAEKNPELAYLVNAEGPKNIGRAILDLPQSKRPSVVFMGSALQYDVQKNGPVNEDTPFVKDGGVYVKSKNKMVAYIRDLVKQGLDAKVAMIFNATGPGQSPDYFFPAVADQAAKIKLGLQKPVINTLYVGHSRDFSHVSDTAQGIFLTLKAQPGELINIASGFGTKLEDVVKTMIKVAGLTSIEHIADPNSPQPEINSFWGDNSKLKELSFLPQKNLEDICRDLFEDRLRANR